MQKKLNREKSQIKKAQKAEKPWKRHKGEREAGQAKGFPSDNKSEQEKIKETPKNKQSRKTWRQKKKKAERKNTPEA